MAQLEREVLRLRSRQHRIITSTAAWRLEHELRLVKIETRIAVYAAFGGIIAGACVSIFVALVIGA